MPQHDIRRPETVKERAATSTMELPRTLKSTSDKALGSARTELTFCLGRSALDDVTPSTEEEVQLMRSTAAGCIQGAWRARRAECRARAAVRIQRVVRGRRGRKHARDAAKSHGDKEDENQFLARYAHAGKAGLGEDPDVCFCCNKPVMSADRFEHTACVPEL